MALRVVGGRSRGTGWSVSPGQRERRAVLEHSAAARQRELARGEQVAIDHRFRHSPTMRPQGRCPVAHQCLKPAILLLKMLCPQEHSLQPDDPVRPGHGDTSAAEIPLTASASFVGPLLAMGATRRH